MRKHSLRTFLIIIFSLVFYTPPAKSSDLYDKRFITACSKYKNNEQMKLKLSRLRLVPGDHQWEHTPGSIGWETVERTRPFTQITVYGPEVREYKTTVTDFSTITRNPRAEKWECARCKRTITHHNLSPYYFLEGIMVDKKQMKEKMKEKTCRSYLREYIQYYSAEINFLRQKFKDSKCDTETDFEVLWMLTQRDFTTDPTVKSLELEAHKLDFPTLFPTLEDGINPSLPTAYMRALHHLDLMYDSAVREEAVREEAVKKNREQKKQNGCPCSIM